MIIAYDLGTGGLKASLYDTRGEAKCFVFRKYDTYCTGSKIIEQKPDDWWNAIISATSELMNSQKLSASDIDAVSISGHSLGVVPLDASGKLLSEKTPIWSDRRASKQAIAFFRKFDYAKWYATTGGGFPPECYSLFKVMHFRENSPELFEKASVFLGTKDYCNFRLTGKIATDFSYASGCGAYNLKRNAYDTEILSAAKIAKEKFADIIPSDCVVGTVSAEAAKITGLGTHTKVLCGGVDNSCMALGSMGTQNGRIYTSLGSSAWIALSSDTPVLDFKYKPYVFSHLIEGMYVSSACIFSSGTSIDWLRKLACPNSDFHEFDKLAVSSPEGANGVIFNPSLAGGSMIEKSPDINGALFGLKLSNSPSDILRAGLEGIAFNMKFALDILRGIGVSPQKMLLTGGGAKSGLWKKIFANVYGMEIISSSISQDAASLGAAALALKNLGIIESYAEIDKLHRISSIISPDSESVRNYANIYSRFREATNSMPIF